MSHLHEFEIAGERYGIADPEYNFGEAVISKMRAKLGKSLDGVTSFRYNFGDDWEHKVKAEKVLPLGTCPAPMCIAGANACPPEDVGDPHGYADFLEAIADPPIRNTRICSTGASTTSTLPIFGIQSTSQRLQRIKA